MRPTVVDVASAEDGSTIRLDGDLILPRLVRRRGPVVEIALVAGGALLLPGDTIDLVIRAGAGCRLSLVDVGGLVVYGDPGGPAAPSGWRAHVELASDAALRWNALPTIVADAAVLHRSTRVTLAARASATVRETLVWGRAGERGGRLDAETYVRDEDGAIARERMVLDGADPVPGYLGRGRVLDAILAVGDRSPVAEVAGATTMLLDRAGSVARWIGAQAHESPLHELWAADERVGTHL